MTTLRSMLIFGLLLATNARGEETASVVVAPQVTRAAIRQALLEQVATPRLPPRLPRFDTDPIRSVRTNTAMTRPGELRAGRVDGMVRRSGPGHAFDADRAADAAARRALDGRGPGGGPERGRGPGRGRPDKDHDGHDHHDDHDGPKPGGPPPP